MSWCGNEGEVSEETRKTLGLLHGRGIHACNHTEHLHGGWSDERVSPFCKEQQGCNALPLHTS